MPYQSRASDDIAAERRRRFYTATDLRNLLTISSATLETWIKKGKLPPPIRPGGERGKRLWTVEVVEQLLAELNTRAS